ncbi:TPA: hypothetical protein EYP38_01335 [Candidatus Micrarchaeota archaeon]|nr:hypothetical protein [Candidatus Micrarchaeota archaeon]
MPIVCIERPNRTKPRYYTAKDAGRVVAYARKAGASDYEILAHVMAGFGLKRTLCQVALIMDLLNNTIFVAAIIGLFKGLAFMAKGIRMGLTGKKTKLPTTILEVLVPKRYITQLGSLFIWVGALEAIASAIVVFMTAIANNLSLLILVSTACDVETPDYSNQVKPMDVGDLEEQFGGGLKASEEFKELAESTRQRRRS